MKIELTDILEQYIKKEKLDNLPCAICDKNNTRTDGKSYIKSVKFGKVYLIIYKMYLKIVVLFFKYFSYLPVYVFI